MNIINKIRIMLADYRFRREIKRRKQDYQRWQQPNRSNVQQARQRTMPYSAPPVAQKQVNDENRFWQYTGISKAEFEQLMEFRADYEKRNNFYVFMIGVILTPITLIGTLLGFVRAYYRFDAGRDIRVSLWPLKPITHFAMRLGAALIWLVIVIGLVILLLIGVSRAYYVWAVLGWLFSMAIASSVIFGVFKLWQVSINNKIVEGRKFGSARFARPDELDTLTNRTGFYIAPGHLFDDKGHILTVAGTRGGKGTNIIIPNLLGAGNVQTSFVIIDPKAENAIISARYQRESGQGVVILNPWGLFELELGRGLSYNPLDILDTASPHLVDDVQMISEMIVPIEAGSHDKFWSDGARSIVTGLLLHLVTSQPPEKKNLKTLWEWVRSDHDEWDDLIKAMGISAVPISGIVVRNASKEILKLQEAGDETFGGIIANALQATDFLKSPSLHQALKSGFDPATLADGKTTVYVIIPADKLRSHSRWLRLVTTSMLRAVIRKPKNRVAFLLDEFAALGYLPEIETALSTYAGYNVTVWPILQSLIQLKNLYKDNWETFIANCTVRQYFTINDNFSAEYISKAIGQTSNVITKKATRTTEDAEVNARYLVTPDELRRESGKRIFMFVGDKHPTYVDKRPYYLVPELSNRANKNPYI